MGMSSSSTNKRALSEINVTPLVDVMLVLLIIFMVTAPMMKQGIDIDLPETANSGVATPEEPFVLTIKKNKKVYIGDVAVPIRQLKTKISAIFENRKDKQIFIHADKVVSYGIVAETMAEVKAAGIHKIGLVTKPRTK
jgi:biopolymer transport protein TolR